MGLRLRKSIRVGKFFRINIGKSGIGYSFGVKGARITQKGKGRVRSTLSIPRTGASDSKSRKTPSTKRQELEVSDIQEQNVQCESEINENFNSCEWSPQYYWYYSMPQYILLSKSHCFHWQLYLLLSLQYYLLPIK